jgi:glutamate-ammonia-ligase adenylyltransferase
VQLFSLLNAHAELLRLIAAIMGSAPRLARHLARAPSTLDALLDRDFLEALPDRSNLDASLADLFARSESYERALDAARRFAKEQIFRVGVQVIEGIAKPDAAGPAFARIAECIITALFKRTADELAESAGRVRGGEFVVVAMGKLGGSEMTAGSDLDLIFVYDTPGDADASDGAKPMPPSLYYTRLAQRLIAALTVPTAEGGLYEVDMQLRPTGNKGPVAVSLESFARYHAAESWTWERLALTRARVVAGSEGLARKVEAVIRDTLCRAGDPAKLKQDAAEMRRKVATQYPGKNAWDLKYAAGGLMDVEFAAQVLQLVHAAADPSVLSQGSEDALRRLRAAGALADGDADTLIAAADLQLALTQVLRIALDGPLDAGSATSGLKALLARVAGVPGFDALQDRLSDLQSRAHAIFETIVQV